MKKILYILMLLLVASPAYSELPDCNDAELQKILKEKIEEKNLVGEKSPISYRNAKLLAKYSVFFQEIPNSEFTPENSYDVADRIMDLKINKKYTEEDYRICKSDYSANDKPLFIFIHKDEQEEGKSVVEVINADLSSRSNRIIFKY